MENKRFGIFKHASKKKIQIDQLDQWIEEVVSGSKLSEDRKLGKVLKDVNKNNILIVSELFRLGRNLMEVILQKLHFDFSFDFILPLFTDTFRIGELAQENFATSY